MTVDTGAIPSNASLSVRDAAALFDAPEPEKKATTAVPAEATPSNEHRASTDDTVDEATQADTDPETVEVAPEDSDETVTIEVDGKKVELKKSELADHYKNGLRQADYTRKTMEAAEQRKTAEAETRKAQEERQKYAQGLQQAQALLQAQLHEQSRIDWQKLLETDPVEYMKQDRIARERQAQLQQVQHEQQQMYVKQQSEQAEQVKKFVSEQQEQLLAKLPEWKDETKAKTDKAAIKDYLKAQGLDDAQIDNITDHRVVLMARDAMLYRKMMDKAKAAAKKVENLPQKVERPGGGDTNPTDGRTTAMKQLAKSGSVADAAAVFNRMFK